MRVIGWLVLVFLFVNAVSAQVGIAIDEDYARAGMLRYVISFSEANVSSVSYVLDGADGVIAQGRLPLDAVERGEVPLEHVPFAAGDSFELELSVSYANGSTVTLSDRFVAPVPAPEPASSGSWWFAPVLFVLVLVPIVAIWIHHLVAKRRLERQHALERSFASHTPTQLAPSFGQGSRHVDGSDQRAPDVTVPNARVGELTRIEQDRQAFGKEFDDAFK